MLLTQLDLIKTSSVLFNGAVAHWNQPFVGMMERNTRLLFAQAAARPHRLYVMFLDEVHTLVQSEGSFTSETGGGGKRDMLAVLLDLLSRNAFRNILIFTATNFKRDLSKAFTRSGRISTHLYMGPLTRHARESVLKDAFQINSNDMDIPTTRSWILQRTTGFTAAQMKDLIHRLDTGQRFIPKNSIRDAIINVARDGEWTHQFIERHMAAMHTLDTTSKAMLSPEDIHREGWKKEGLETIKECGFVATNSVRGSIAVSHPSTHHIHDEYFERIVDPKHRLELPFLMAAQLLTASAVEHVYVVDQAFAIKKGKHFPEDLLELYEALQDQQNAVIVLLLEETVGLTCPEITVSHGQSETSGNSSAVTNTEGSNKQKSKFESRGTNQGSSKSGSLSLGFSYPFAISFSGSYQESTYRGFSTNTGTSDAYGHSESVSHTETRSDTLGVSSTKSLQCRPSRQENFSAVQELVRKVRSDAAQSRSYEGSRAPPLVIVATSSQPGQELLLSSSTFTIFNAYSYNDHRWNVMNE